MQASQIIGVGSYLPKRKISNDELAKTVDTSDEWIQKRTGISSRYFVGDDENTASIACQAAKAAMQNANVKPTDIDLIILATTTPDNTFPATASVIQHKLGVPPCAFFDVQAVCSGFIYALAMADNMLKLGQAKKALVIGAEVYSKILDWKDRSTCVLFGDGAGAVILQAVPEESSGVLSTHLFGDGSYHDALYVDGGVTQEGGSGHVRMQGKEVFRIAVDKMAQAMQIALTHNNYTISDLDWFVPHQANIRIMNKVGESLGLAEGKTIATVSEHANISAATIPVALDFGVQQGYFKSGDLIGLSALGGGFAWGSALIKWNQ